MANQILDYSTNWPEDYFLEEDDMTDSAIHSWLIRYLIEVLRYLFRLEGYFISDNLLILQPGSASVGPDIGVLPIQISETDQTSIKSWDTGQPNRPVPLVVFEIASDSTWPQDLNEKIVRYGQLGVREYFAYDPNLPQVWRGQSTRLLGWRYTPDGVEVIPANAQGHLRSEVLDSTLVSDEGMLRLYDSAGNLRLTRAEAEFNAREQERLMREQAEQREFQALMARQEAEQREIEARQAREQAEQQANQERQAREQAEKEVETLREQLRRLQAGQNETNQNQ